MKDGASGKDAFLPGRPAAAATPGLHWTEAGRTIRGRTRVLEHVATSPPAGPPESYELRDGQVYRWTC
jgi:hypothetical protein